jgi:hypothetical protein
LSINSSISGVGNDVLALNGTLQYLLALNQYMNGSVAGINQSIGVVHGLLVQSLSEIAAVNSSLNALGVKIDGLNLSLYQMNGSLNNLSLLVNSVGLRVNDTYNLVLSVNNSQTSNFQALMSLIQLVSVNQTSTNDIPIFTSITTDAFEMDPNAIVTVSAALSINQSQANISNVWYEVEYGGVRLNYSATPVSNLNWSFSFSTPNLGQFYFRNAYANSTHGNLTVAPLTFAVNVRYAGNGGFSGATVLTSEAPVVVEGKDEFGLYVLYFVVGMVVLFLLLLFSGKLKS